jgi:hypothetical protein
VKNETGFLNNGKMCGWGEGGVPKIILKLGCLGTFSPAYWHRIQNILNIPNISLLAMHLETNGSCTVLNKFLAHYFFTVETPVATNITPIQNNKMQAASSFTFSPVQLYSTCN